MASDRYNEIKQRLIAQNVQSNHQNDDNIVPSTGSSERLEKIKEKLRSGGFTTSMTADDVESFLYDSQSFMERSANAYSGLTWEQATSEEYKAKRKETSEDLTARAAQVRTFLNANKASIDPEIYENYMQYLDDFSEFQTQSLLSFEKKYKLYGTYDSQEDYDRFIKDNNQTSEWQQKYNGMSANELQAAAAGLPDGKEKRWLLASAADTPKTLEEVQQDLAWAQGEYQYLKRLKNEGAELAALKSNLEAATPGAPGYTELKKQYEDMLKRYPQMSIFEDLDGQITAVKDRIWELEKEKKYKSLSRNQDYASESTKVPIWLSAGYINDSDEADDSFSLMNEYELGNYYYLANTSGYESATEYYDYLQPYLDKRRHARIAEENKKLATEHPFWADIKSIGATLSSGIGLIDIAFQNAEKWMHEATTGEYAGPINYYSAAMTPNTIATSIRHTRAQNIANKYGVIDIDPEEHPIWAKILNGKSLGDVYQLGMSMADSAAVLALSPILGGYGTVLLGGSAGTQGVINAIENGATDGEALAMGVLNGFFEMFFEKHSLETLLSSGGRSFIDAVWRQAVAEGSEEFFTSAANNVADILVMAEKSGYMKNVDAYIAAGYSESEAMQKALLDMGIDMGWDFVGGLISGGFMGGGGKIATNSVQQFQNYKTGRTIKKAEGGMASLMNITDEVKGRTTEDMRAAIDKQLGKVKKKATSTRVGKLYKTVNAANNQANASANQSDIAKSLMRNNFSEQKANAIAEALVSRYNGQELTKEQNKLLRSVNNNEAVQNAISNIMDNTKSTMGQRSQNIRDFQRDVEIGRIARKTGMSAETVKAIVDASFTDTVEKAPESSYEVSADSKATQISTGQAISVQKIASVKDGTMTFWTKDGSEVDAQDVSFDSENEADVYAAVAKLSNNASVANLLVDAYHMEPMDGIDFAQGIREAYQYGQLNISQNEMQKYGSYAMALSNHQRELAYNLGQLFSGKQISREVAAIRRNKKNGRKAEGAVHFDGDRSQLNATQRAGLDAMELLSKALGVQFYVFESEVDADGNRIGEDGWYDPKDGSIHIDLYAGADGKGTLLFTVAHELTHYIRQWSPAKFKVLANYLMEQYGKQGVPVNELIDDQIAKAKRDNRTIDREEAFEELVADSMETMLSSGKVLQALADLRKQDRTLAEKIRDWFRDFTEKLKGIVSTYKDAKPDSVEGRLVADMKDVISTFEALYGDALLDASENFNAEAQKKPAESGVRYSIKRTQNMSWDEQIKGVLYGGKNIRRNDTLIVAKPADTVVANKIADVPLAIPLSVLTKASSGKDVSHSIKRGKLAKLDEGIKNAPMTIVNPERNAVVFVTGVMQGGLPVVVAFDMNAIFDGDKVHKATSIHLQVDMQAMLENLPQSATVYVQKNELDPVGATNNLRGLAAKIKFVDRVARDSENVNKKFSARDSTGKQLSERQQEYFKDSQCRDREGNLLVLYHQTGGVFTIFDTRHSGAGNNDGGTPFGIFLKRSVGDIGLTGKKQMVLYANITNPLRAVNRDDLARQLCEISGRYAAISDKHKQLDAEYRRKIDQAQVAWNDYVKQWRESNPDAKRTDLYEDPKFNELFNAEDDLVEEWEAASDKLSVQAKEAITEDLRKAGYDGIFLEEDAGSWGRHTDAIIALDANQVKNTDNRNPTNDPDIRHSSRDPALQKIRKALEQENAQLKEDVSRLEELVKLQRTGTGGAKFTKTSVEAAARMLKKYANVKRMANTSELTQLLHTFYEHIATEKELSWEKVREQAQPAVRWLQDHVDLKEERGEYAQTILNQMKDSRICLDESQRAEAAYRFGSYNDFRKALFGKVTLVSDGNTSLDSWWHSMADQFPDVFRPDTSSTDMPGELFDIIEQLRNTDNSRVEYEYNRASIAMDLTRQVYDSYWRVSTLYTVADRAQQKIDRLKGHHYQQMNKLRAEQNARIEQIKEENRAARKKAVDQVRETAEKRDARAKLQKLVLDTAKWISYPAKTDVKCPDILKKPYEAFLQGIDLSSERFANGGEDTKNDLRLANAMDSLATALDKIMFAQNPNTDPNDVNFAVLDAGYLDLPANFVQKLRDMTESIKSMMVKGEYVVNNMTAAEVRQLSQMIRTLNHSIKTMSKLYANLRFSNVEALGLDTMDFLAAIEEIEKTGGMKDFAQWDNALPYYVFKRFGKGGESIFEGLMDAQDKLAFLARDIFAFQKKTWSDREAKVWSTDTHTITLPNGTRLTLTTADAMSIYCLSRRAHALPHLLGGGIRVMGIQKRSKKAKDSRSLLTIQDVDAIISSLTDRQKQVAERIQEFMSTVCSEWGNEISMKRFLTREFTEKFYFPIESNNENLPLKDPAAQQSDLFRLLNVSATKPLTQGANNEVIIHNIFDVFAGHASDMARLNAYGMALLDYMKWLNYRERGVNEEGQIDVKGVRKSMEMAYGEAANNYVLNLIKDVNGRVSDGGDPTILMKWMRAAKTAMVGNSLRVATLQVTAYPRAALVLSPKSLALGLSKLPKIEMAKKYCGIALWKSFGFYDTNISRSIEDQMKGVTDIKQKLIELSLKGAEWGDAITWGALWNACEYEVAATKQYKIGSEEFYQAVGKKLREVIYRTQVVDSPLTRSQIMRSKRGMAQEAAAFMSESTVSANILMDAGFEFGLEKRRTGSAKAAWKNTGSFIAKAVAVYSIVQLTAAMVEGLWDAWRDDDDDEFWEKYKSAFVVNLVLDLLPINKLPVLADVADMILAQFDLGFYSSDRMSTTWITQANSAFKAWKEVLNGKPSATTYNALYKTVRAVSSYYGVSFSGVMREGVALWNNTAGAYDSTWKIRTYEPSKTSWGEQLYEAIIDGDDRRAESIRKKFTDKDGKYDPSAERTYIRKALRNHDPRIKEAALAHINGDMRERSRIMKLIIADGFEEADVQAAIKAEIDDLREK